MTEQTFDRKYNHKKQPPELFYKKCVLENFANFKGKRLCQSFFLNKVAGLRSTTISKRDSGTGVFLLIFKIFKKIFLTEHLRRILDHLLPSCRWTLQILWQQGTRGLSPGAF